MKSLKRFDQQFESTFNSVLLTVAKQDVGIEFPTIQDFIKHYLKEHTTIRWDAIDSLLNKEKYQPNKPFSLHHFTVKTVPSFQKAPSQELLKRIDYEILQQVNAIKDVNTIIKARKEIQSSVINHFGLRLDPEISFKKVQDHVRNYITSSIERKFGKTAEKRPIKDVVSHENSSDGIDDLFPKDQHFAATHDYQTQKLILEAFPLPPLIDVPTIRHYETQQDFHLPVVGNLGQKNFHASSIADLLRLAMLKIEKIVL